MLQSRSSGKERDSETGLDYFGARYYGSSMGRWLSADWSATPVAVPYADLSDPQTLNLYGYVRNNPVTDTDADGHCRTWSECKQVISGAVSGGASFVKNTAIGIAQFAGATESERGMMMVEPVVTAAMEYQEKGVSGVASALLDQGPEGAMAVTTEAVLTGGLAASSRVNSIMPEGTVTRYMGPGEATTTAKTGEIPNTNAAGEPRPTHVTTDKPLNSASAAQGRYELPNKPSHRATVPSGRVGQLGPTPDGRPTTSGGGSQAATNRPIPVKPNEIKKLKD